MEEVSREWVLAQANAIKKILEENLLLDPIMVHSKIEEAKAIKKSLEAHGFLVRWNTALDSSTLGLVVDVVVLKPKEDMSPDAAALYDKWFRAKCGVKK